MKTVHANPPEKICRLCLSDSGVILPIFEGEIAERFSVPLPQKILSCLAIKVCADDPLPPHICHRCLFEVDRFHEFRETCKRTNTTFNKICNNAGDSISFDVNQVLEIKQELHDESVYHDAISDLLSDDENADVGSSRFKKRNRCLSLLESMKRAQQAQLAASTATPQSEPLASEWLEQAKTTTSTDASAAASHIQPSLECRFCAKTFIYESSLLEHEDFHTKGVVNEDDSVENVNDISQIEHAEHIEPMEEHQSHEPEASNTSSAQPPVPVSTSEATNTSIPSSATTPVSTLALAVACTSAPCPVVAENPSPASCPSPSLPIPVTTPSTASIPGASPVAQQAIEVHVVSEEQTSQQTHSGQNQAVENEPSQESGPVDHTSVETVSLTDVTAMLLEGAFEGVRAVTSQTSTPCRYCHESFNNSDLLRRHERLYCNRRPSLLKLRPPSQQQQPHSQIQQHQQSAHQTVIDTTAVVESQSQLGQTHHLIVHTQSSSQSHQNQMPAQHADQQIMYGQKVVVETAMEAVRSCKHCHKDFIHRGSLWRHQMFCDANPERDLNRIVAGSKRKTAAGKGCDMRNEQQMGTEVVSLPVTSQSVQGSHLRRNGMHTNSGPFKCKFCEKRFLHRGSWWRHQKMFCSVNPEIPTVKAEAKVRNCQGAPSFACRYCERTFLHRGSCWHHEQTHTGLKEHACRYCSKTFNEKSRLARHERMHLGIKPFSCRQCGKAFCDASNLKNHEQIHGERASFLCAWCGKSYTRRALLLKHEQVHAGEGQIFTCSSCPRTFPDPDSLNAHASSHNQLKRRLYLCQTCGQTFRSQSLLVQHHQQCHPHIHQSSQPQPQQASQSQHIASTAQIREQEQSHHICNICSKVFSDATSLQHHELLHRNTAKEYCCPNITCNAVFLQQAQLDTHLLLHEGQKPPQVPSSVAGDVSSSFTPHQQPQTHTHQQQQLLAAHDISHQQTLQHHELLHREETYVIEGQDMSGQTIAVPIL